MSQEIIESGKRPHALARASQICAEELALKLSASPSFQELIRAGAANSSCLPPLSTDSYRKTFVDAWHKSRVTCSISQAGFVFVQSRRSCRYERQKLNSVTSVQAVRLPVGKNAVTVITLFFSMGND
jgi:hypothetical protein